VAGAVCLLASAAALSIRDVDAAGTIPPTRRRLTGRASRRSAAADNPTAHRPDVRHPALF